MNIGRLLILSSLIVGCGPSIYEKAAAKRAPRDCVAIAAERLADNENCALEGNPFKFTGALFRLDGAHRVLDEMTLTFEVREAFSDSGTIEFDVTITDPGGREQPDHPLLRPQSLEVDVKGTCEQQEREHDLEDAFAEVEALEQSACRRLDIDADDG